jgi:beta-lactam-binding protein with PASTA domain
MLIFKNDFIKQCLNNIECNMSSSNSSRRVINNLNNSSNTISVPNSTELDISNNLTNTNNQILVRNNQVNLTVNHHNYSLTSTAHVQPQSQSQGNSLSTQSNNASTSSQPQLNQNHNNLLSPPDYNASNSSNISNRSI